MGARKALIDRLIFGCGHLTGGSSQKTADALTARCFEHGLTRFDTAPLYGLGTAERSLGKALAKLDAKQDATVQTKFGLARPPYGALRAFVPKGMRTIMGSTQPTSSGAPPTFADPSLPRGDFSGSDLVSALRASLKDSQERVAPARIDTLLLHEAYPGPDVDRAISALAQLRAEGLTANVGLANGCVHSMKLDAFAANGFWVQAAAPPCLFSGYCNGRVQLLGDKHILHSIIKVFRACRSDHSIGHAADATETAFAALLGRKGCWALLPYALATSIAPKARLIFATSRPERLDAFLMSWRKAAADGDLAAISSHYANALKFGGQIAKKQH